LTRLNRQVLLVTHHEELRERFPQQIQVSRASDVSPSRVEVR
jgi:DNA repair exonuclease SbcCD ATPase subunit